MAGRRIGAGLLAVLAVATLGLTGCNQDNTPKAYNTLTQQNFVELCTNTYYKSTGDITGEQSASTASTLDPALSPTGSTIKSNVQASDQSSCLCMYSVFVQQLPINKAAASAGYTGTNFTDLNAKLKTDPTGAWATLPDSVTSAVSACASGSTTTTTPASSTTTAAPTTTTAN